MADASSVLGLNGLPLSDELPNRPGYGDYLPSPRSVTLRANYFEVKPGSGLTLYQYDLGVSSAPNGTSPKLDRVIELLLEHAEFAARKPDLATDSKSNLVSRTDLGIEEKAVEIQYTREGEDRSGPRTKTYQVKITKSHVLPLVNFMQSLSAPRANNPFRRKKRC